MSRNLSVLRTRITEKEHNISLLNERINTYKVLSANYDKQLVNLNKQMELSVGLNKAFSKQLRREHTKTVLVGIAGLAATVLAAVYIK